MPFTNPILGGNTLIREAIQSPNYVPGVSGWSINKDGTAEFADATVRGTLDAGGVVIDSTGIHFGGSAPGVPGFEFTTNIPSELAAYYIAPSDLVTVRIGYTGTANMYWYEGLKRDGVVVYGWVESGTVNESRIDVWESLGGYPRLIYGADPSKDVAVTFGPLTGTGNGYVEVRGGYSFIGQPDAMMQWYGDANFRNGNSVTYEPGIGMTAMPMMYGYKGTINAGPTASTQFITGVIPFPSAFASAPFVVPNINFGPGAAADWHVRAVNITTTDFQIMGYGPLSTWATTIAWVAIELAS